MARDPDRRVSIAPQTSRSLSDSTAELPPPVTVLPAVRRSRIVSPAPPRTPRPEKSSTTGDFIATLKTLLKTLPSHVRALLALSSLLAYSGQIKQAIGQAARRAVVGAVGRDGPE